MLRIVGKVNVVSMFYNVNIHLVHTYLITFASVKPISILNKTLDSQICYHFNSNLYILSSKYREAKYCS